MLKNLFLGRLNRKQFLVRLILSIFVFLAFIVLLSLASKAYASVRDSYMVGFLSLFFAAYIYQVSIYVKRLRDSGGSLFLIILTFIPLVNFLSLLYLLFAPSKESGSTA